MQKGEVMFLINKTNPDWWSVRKADRTDGFVPANYVREIEPRVVPVSFSFDWRVFWWTGCFVVFIFGNLRDVIFLCEIGDS